MQEVMPRKILSRVKTLGITALLMCVACASGFYLVNRQLAKSLTETQSTSAALRYHTLSDMHHEGLRALIYSAMVAQDVAFDPAIARKEFDTIVGDNRDGLKGLRELKIPAELKSSVQQADLDTYLSLAEKALAAALRDRATAGEPLKAFDAEFRRLVPIMQKIGSQLEERMGILRSDAEDLVFKSQLTFVALVVLGVLSVGLLIAATIRSFILPFRQQVAAIKALGEDRTDVNIAGLDRPDEIGEMARSIASFRDALLEKRRHQTEALAAKEAIEAERKKKEVQDKYYADAHVVFMDSFTSALEHLSAGDLNYRIDTVYSSEYESIRQSFNQAAGRIQEAMISIVGSSGEIRVGTERILTAADELARHTEEQASSLEETSASMEEMAATVRQNANNAQEASATAFTARELASAGGKISEQAVAAMQKIERSSRQVTEIVDLIEEIAFQTNILALNAAVEAARAGDAGKGFAVVANEVRTLSQRSSQALKDIKSLIASSNNDVNDGAGLVKAVGTSLTNIVTSVSKVSELISEIAAASQEQATGVDQVTRAVANMDEMTQQNAALVQETNAALHTAQRQIQELNKAVSMFDTGREAIAQLSRSRTPEAPSDNPVREQHRILEKTMSGVRPQRKRAMAGIKARHSAMAMPVDDDWQEF